MKLSHNFMKQLASMPVASVADWSGAFTIWDNYILEKTSSNKRYLSNINTREYAFVSGLLFGTFVQALTS